MPSATLFVVYGVLLRLTEGVGWAMSNTTTLAFIPVLFPSHVGKLTVSLKGSKEMYCDNVNQGLIFGAIGLGYAAGPPIGSLLVVVRY